MDFVNSNDYLSSKKGNFTERNGGRTPWSTTLDTKITHTIGKIQLTADIFNLTNLINNEWGKMYFISSAFNSTSSVGLTRTNSGLNDPLFTFSKPKQTPYSIDGIGSKWNIQLGLRYNF